MHNTLIYIILSLTVLSVLLYLWMVHKSKKAYVEKDTGIVYYLIETLQIESDGKEITSLYTLQSTKDGHIIHISKEYLNKNFL